MTCPSEATHCIACIDTFKSTSITTTITRKTVIQSFIQQDNVTSKEVSGKVLSRRTQGKLLVFRRTSAPATTTTTG